MISMTRSLAHEYGRYGIRVNIVLPGTVRTPIWNKRVEEGSESAATLERWYPLGRIVEPIDVARAVGFLASDLASRDHRRGAAGRLRPERRQYRDDARTDARGFLRGGDVVTPAKAGARQPPQAFLLQLLDARLRGHDRGLENILGDANKWPSEFSSSASAIWA